MSRLCLISQGALSASEAGLCKRAEWGSSDAEEKRKTLGRRPRHRVWDRGLFGVVPGRRPRHRQEGVQPGHLLFLQAEKDFPSSMALVLSSPRRHAVPPSQEGSVSILPSTPSSCHSPHTGVPTPAAIGLSAPAGAAERGSVCLTLFSRSRCLALAPAEVASATYP